MEKIETGKLVTFGFQLYVIDDKDDQVLDFQTAQDAPQQIVYGVTPGVMAPLEEALKGLHAGDTFDVTIPAAQAYGEYMPERVMDFSKQDLLQEGNFDPSILEEGKTVTMVTEDGYLVQGTVLKSEGDVVTIDFNPKLAGKDVRFVGKIDGVRDATEEELNMAAGGGCHCGGGCGSCGDGACGSCGDGSCGCGGCGD